VDRTGIAVIGAAAMVVGGVLSWDQAVADVDAHTLVLLFGMMIVAAYLRLSGFFALVVAWVTRRARTPAGLLGTVVAASGVLSALFVNDVVCVVLAPLVVSLTRQLALPPVPYLIALATASNVGSVATLTGNPQNMLVGSFSVISYRSFLLAESPVAVIGLLCVWLMVWLAYRRHLPPALGEIRGGPRVPVHYPLMVKTNLVVLVMLVAFLAGVPIARRHRGRRLHAPHPARQAGARLSRDQLGPARALHRALRRDRRGGAHRPRAGAARPRRHLGPAPPGHLPGRDGHLVEPRLKCPGRPAPQVLRSQLRRADARLASPRDGLTLAGNLTLIGSVANLIVVESAREARIRIGFLEYCRVGVPLTFVTLVLGWLILVLLPV
jgi:Na+/H+ antiporter NhaD/arsenite permease-like protein